MKSRQRVFLKLSGEALAGSEKTGFHEETVKEVARQIQEGLAENVELGVVIGGGNFWRGRTGSEIGRNQSDQIGMLATVMNSLYVSEILRSMGVDTEIFTPFSCGGMTKLFSFDEVEKTLASGKVAFFAGGTGHSLFSTDTAVTLRAAQMSADSILLAKSIDGVYDSDPKQNPKAKKYEEISIQEIIDRQLGVMDLTASIMCMENKIPIWVFALQEPNAILNAMKGKVTGTVVNP
ncbi:uridylate kinase [Clostridia bacterium]|nr:uridylate kinase [Clostridia bacterium]